MYRLVIKISFVSFLLFLAPNLAQAGFLDDVSYCTANGSCTFADVAVGLNSLIKMLLGAMGAVALVYFVWGGIQWLTSGGSAERVNRGKQIMINTVFAIILAFGSYLLVSFFINDVLNVKTEFRIEEGPFRGCDGMPINTDCGDSRRCAAGFPEPWTHLNGSCLYICQLESVLLSGGAKIGDCMPSLPPGWELVPGASSTWCPASHVCAYPPEI